MWANAKRDGRPVEHRWRPLFNAAKSGCRSLLERLQTGMLNELKITVKDDRRRVLDSYGQPISLAVEIQ